MALCRHAPDCHDGGRSDWAQFRGLMSAGACSGTQGSPPANDGGDPLASPRRLADN